LNNIGVILRERKRIANNSNIIYDVDITNNVTPIMVREALIQCFYEAHCNVLELARETFGNPPEKKFEEFIESLRIKNRENSTDWKIIPVYLKTLKNRGINNNYLLLRFLDRFPFIQKKLNFYLLKY
jgi:hypothetical protein